MHVSGVSAVLLVGAFAIALGAVMAAGVWVSVQTYYWVRREFYTRPLTAEERWAETSAEAMDEAEWSSLLAVAEQSPADDEQA